MSAAILCLAILAVCAVITLICAICAAFMLYKTCQYLWRIYDYE